MKPIGQVILEVDDILNSAGVAHAFGGALALAYYARPRGTVDVDLNVATPFASRESLLASFEGHGWEEGASSGGGLPAAGIRLRQADETVVLDLSFVFDPFHEAVLSRTVVKPYLHGGQRRELSFLAVEDLIVFKMSFGRPQDWVDMASIVQAGTPIDVDAVEQRAVAFIGPRGHPSTARLRSIVAGHVGTG